MFRFAASAVVLTAVLWLVVSSQGASGHGDLPINIHAQKASPKDLRLGYGEVKLFGWTMWAVDSAWSGRRRRVCFSVNLLGPLARLPHGHFLGPETGGHRCGPIKAKRGVIVAVPEEAGSTTPPSGKTESWSSFDVGLAAYQPSVDQTRLVFSDGESEVLKTHAVPEHLALKGAEPFRYALFAFQGCVREVQGIARGRVVARFGGLECG
jgi:hypothetical protein